MKAIERILDGVEWGFGLTVGFVIAVEIVSLVTHHEFHFWFK